MSNSSRIEAATRSHVGATLTSQQITELVKVADPNFKGGVYPSDAAYKLEGTTLVPRGKMAYEDGVLEYLGPNSFKVLTTEKIVRRPTARVSKTAPVSVPVAEPAKPVVKTVSQPPVATKTKARDARAS